MKITSTKQWRVENLNEHELEALFCDIYVRFMGSWPSDPDKRLHKCVVAALEDEEDMQ